MNDVQQKKRSKNTAAAVRFRNPEPDDTPAVHALIGRCAPLDHNSIYVNAIQCSHFGDTCMIAEDDDGVLGFVSAYIRPDQPDALFVWQVAVDQRGRGMGIGGRLLGRVLEANTDKGVRYLQATIIEDNEPSWALFRGVAKRAGVPFEDELHFHKDKTFAGKQSAEHLISIGPLGKDDIRKLVS